MYLKRPKAVRVSQHISLYIHEYTILCRLLWSVMFLFCLSLGNSEVFRAQRSINTNSRKGKTYPTKKEGTEEFGKQKLNLSKQKSSFYSYFLSSPLTSTPLPSSSRRNSYKHTDFDATNDCEALEGKCSASSNKLILDRPASPSRAECVANVCNIIPLFCDNTNDVNTVIEITESSATEITTEEDEDVTIHFTPELFDSEFQRHSPDMKGQDNVMLFPSEEGYIAHNQDDNTDGRERGAENDLNTCNLNTKVNQVVVLPSKCSSVEAQGGHEISTNVQRETKRKNRLSRSKNKTIDLE